MTQLPLPTFDLRPLCAICRQPSSLLGQLHPRLRHRACPECCRRFAIPDYIRSDATYDDRLAALEIELTLRALLIPPPRPHPLHTVSALISPLQNGLPFCRKCGRVHDRHHWGRYADLCQSCDDQQALESLWARRAIFAGDDPETVLDRLYAAFPDLFERGILPDAWFDLMQAGV